MATQKPVEWVSSLITRFEEQVNHNLLASHLDIHRSPVNYYYDNDTKHLKLMPILIALQ